MPWLKFSAFTLPLGGDLCQVNPALHCSVPAPGGTKFPGYFHSPRNGPGREVRLLSPAYTAAPINMLSWCRVCLWSMMPYQINQHMCTCVFIKCVGNSLHLCPIWSPSHCRLSRYQQFKDFQRRILVATNLFGRGMDIERVNIVFNYDMPEDSDTYLHRVRI